MRNEEFIELRNKFLLGVLVALIITIPFLLLFIRQYRANKSSVLEAYGNKKTFTVLIYKSSDCSKCKMIRSKLDSLDVYYLEYDLDKAVGKETLLKRVGVSEKDLIIPALVYVKNGESIVRSLEIDDEESIDEFVNYSKTA